MTDFDIAFMCFFIPISYVIVYMAGKGDLLFVACKMLQEQLEKYQERSIKEPQKVDGWIQVSERFPDEEYDTVLAVTDKNHYAVYVYTTEHGFRTMDIDAAGEVIAWMPLPVPYDMRKKVE